MSRFIFLLFLFWSGLASSETLYSDFVFVMKNVDFIETLPKSVRGSHFDKADNVLVEKPFKTKIEGITYSLAFSVNYDLTHLNLAQSKIQIVLENLNLNIKKIQTDDTITKRRGNILLKTRIQGHCNNLNITSKDSKLALNAVVSLIDETGLFNPSIKLENIDLSSDLDVLVDSCTGFKEYENELRTGIFNWIKNDSNIVRDTERQIQEIFRKKIREATAVALKIQNNRLLDKGKVTLIPYYIKSHSNNHDLYIHGRIFTNFDNGNNEFEYIPMQINPFQLPNNSSLILSVDYIKRLSSIVYRNSGYSKDFNSQDIPALKELHDNRFAQAFAFPDMANFSRNANFVLRSYLVSDPEVSLSQSNDLLVADIRSRARIDNWVPRDGEYQNQLSINSNFDVKASMNIENNKLSLSFDDPVFDLQAVWDPQYIQNYNPNTFISLSRFREGIESSILDMKIEYSLPELKLRVDKNLGPDFIELNQDYVFINYVQK